MCSTGFERLCSTVLCALLQSFSLLPMKWILMLSHSLYSNTCKVTKMSGTWIGFVKPWFFSSSLDGILESIFFPISFSLPLLLSLQRISWRWCKGIYCLNIDVPSKGRESIRCLFPGAPASVVLEQDGDISEGMVWHSDPSAPRFVTLFHTCFSSPGFASSAAQALWLFSCHSPSGSCGNQAGQREQNLS